jgi:propanol-preferring alcohol dehydrogenase
MVSMMTPFLTVHMTQPPDVVIPFSEYIFRDIRVRGSFICSPKEAEEMLQLVVKHNIKVESNIFHGIREIPTVVDMLSKGQYRGKGVIVIDEGTSRLSKL